MEIIEEIMGEVVVEIINSDRATINESQALKNALQLKLDAGYNKFIVDLPACEFVDSTILGVLLSNLKKAANNTSKNYLAKAPQKSEIFSSGREGELIKIGCWIGSSIKVPTL